MRIGLGEDVKTGLKQDLTIWLIIGLIVITFGFFMAWELLLGGIVGWMSVGGIILLLHKVIWRK